MSLKLYNWISITLTSMIMVCVLIALSVFLLGENHLLVRSPLPSLLLFIVFETLLLTSRDKTVKTRTPMATPIGQEGDLQKTV